MFTSLLDGKSLLYDPKTNFTFLKYGHTCIRERTRENASLPWFVNTLYTDHKPRVRHWFCVDLSSTSLVRHDVRY